MKQRHRRGMALPCAPVFSFHRCRACMGAKAYPFLRTAFGERTHFCGPHWQPTGSRLAADWSRLAAASTAPWPALLRALLRALLPALLPAQLPAHSAPCGPKPDPGMASIGRAIRTGRLRCGPHRTRFCVVRTPSDAAWRAVRTRFCVHNLSRIKALRCLDVSPSPRGGSALAPRYQAMVSTTPPSTRNAAPVVADACGEQT